MEYVTGFARFWRQHITFCTQSWPKSAKLRNMRPLSRFYPYKKLRMTVGRWPNCSQRTPLPTNTTKNYTHYYFLRSTECSEVRTKRSAWGSNFGVGDISLNGHCWFFLIIFWSLRGFFFLFGTDIGTHTGHHFAKFQKNSSTGSIFMDDSRAKNGPFWGQNQFFWGTAGPR